MKTEYKLEYSDSDLEEYDQSPEDDIETEDGDDFLQEGFHLDGYFTISSYHDGYEPFAELWQNNTGREQNLLIRPVTAMKQIDQSVRSLTDVFDKLKTMTVFRIPKNFSLRQTGSIPQKKLRSKLCRSLLLNQNCEFSSQCKFAHKFDLLQKCKFDHCKKTQLVGPGLFKTPVGENICPLRHNFESLDSFILRTKEKTKLKINISIFKNNLNDLKQMLSGLRDCSVELLIV